MTIWINTFPKSGTALMRQALSCHGRDLGHLQMFSGTDNEEHSLKDLIKAVGHWSNETDAIATAHLHYKPELFNLIGDKMLFLIRDPRDVVVSHVYYVRKTEGHPLHKWWKHLEFTACLQHSIWGNVEHGLPNIADRFLPYLGWMHQVPVVRFEEVAIDNAVRFSVFNRLLTTFDLNCTINEMGAAIDRATSSTFRKGEVGGYASDMVLHVTEEFDRDFGWLLDLLEYKRDE